MNRDDFYMPELFGVSPTVFWIATAVGLVIMFAAAYGIVKLFDHYVEGWVRKRVSKNSWQVINAVVVGTIAVLCAWYLRQPH